MRGVKRGNEYQREFKALYAKIPKSVFAAVALSYANWACGTEAQNMQSAVDRFLEEWSILHENGIIPQKPLPHFGIFVPRETK